MHCLGSFNVSLFLKSRPSSPSCTGFPEPRLVRVHEGPQAREHVINAHPVSRLPARLSGVLLVLTRQAAARALWVLARAGATCAAAHYAVCHPLQAGTSSLTLLGQGRAGG